MKLSKQRPSPAMVVALTALVVSLAGTAFAGPIAQISLNKAEKKQTRKIAGTVANRQINRRAPQLAVASAASAGVAKTANTADTATTATTANSAKNAEHAGTADLAGAVSNGVPGVALAGVVVAADGSVKSWFNRFGGKPTIGHAITGDYGIKFPGLALNADDFVHMATRGGEAGVSGFIRVRSPVTSPGDIAVRTRNSANTEDQDTDFYYTVYAAQ